MKKLMFLMFLIPQVGFCVDLTITIPDPIATRVINAFSNRFGYTPTIADPNNPGGTIPNPQTRTQFVKNYFATYIKGVVVDFEADAAGKQARQSTLSQSNSEITVTAP